MLIRNGNLQNWYFTSKIMFKSTFYSSLIHSNCWVAFWLEKSEESLSLINSTKAICVLHLQWVEKIFCDNQIPNKSISKKFKYIHQLYYLLFTSYLVFHISFLLFTFYTFLVFKLNNFRIWNFSSGTFA